MSYQVLARKLRPKKFADLVGQEHVTQALLNSIKQSRLHHAYLLTGTRGVGKTTIARILAKSLNCDDLANGEPCGECESCLSVDEGRFVDLLEIDAASNTGIDNIREVLENAQYMPTAGKFKIYIIDEVHMLSKSAFNAMLKTLEEPPSHVKFILATTDSHKVPVTVLSRCLQFILKNLTTDQISDYLKKILIKENIAYEESVAYLIARAANGSMRDALSLLDQAIALGNGTLSTEIVQKMLGVVERDFLYDIFIELHQENKQELYEKINQLLHQSAGFNYLLDEMALILKDLALTKLFDVDLLYSKNEKFNLLTSLLSDEEIQLYYQTIINGKKDQVIAPDEYTGFLMVIMRMLSFQPYFLADKNQQDTKTLRKSFKKKIIDLPADDSQTEVKSFVTNDLSSDNKSSSLSIEPASLVSLDDEQWIQYMQAINKKIQSHVIISRCMALVGMSDQKVICAIQDENHFSQEQLNEGKLKIEKAFLELFNIQLQWQEWTDGLVSYRDLKKMQDLELQRKGLEYLNSDKTAVKLKELFKGEWDASSIRFKS